MNLFTPAEVTVATPKTQETVPLAKAVPASTATPTENQPSAPPPGGPHYALLAAQIVGATCAYCLFLRTEGDWWLWLAIAFILGCLGPVEHGVVRLLERVLNFVPPCRYKPILRLATNMLAAFLGVWIYHAVHHTLT